MRFSRKKVWAYGAALVVELCAIVAAAQATQHARLMVQAGGSWVTAVAFSSDGRWALTGGVDETARLWDVVTGKELQQFEEHSAVQSVSFSRDGRMVVTGSEDRTARLWDVKTGKEVQRFEGHSDAVNAVALSPDGRRVVSGSDDGTARLWDVATGKQLQLFQGHSGHVQSVAFSPDARRVLTGSRDGTARLWDVATGREQQRFQANNIWANPVAFSPDGRWIITGGENKSARLWDVGTGKELQRFQGHSGMVVSATFSPDGHKVLTGSDDKTARLWDVETGKELERFQGHSFISSVAFSPDGRSILAGSWDNTARLWDIGTGKELQSFEGHSDVVKSSAFSSDGRRVMTAGEQQTAAVWDVGTGKELQRFEWHYPLVNSVAFSRDGREVLTGGKDRTARLWDVATGKELQRFEGQSSSVFAVAFSPDGARVLTYSRDMLRLWDVVTGKELQQFQGDSKGSRFAAFSPDGLMLLTGFADTARLLEVATGKELRRFQGDDSGVGPVAFSPDSRRALTGTGRTVQLWDVETGKELQRFQAQSGMVASATFSPDGLKVLTGGDNTARLWDLETGKELQRLQEHSFVLDVAFSPDGRRILTHCVGGTARLWDVSSGNELASLVSFTGGGWAVVDPAGHYDASDPDSSSFLYWVTDNMRTIDLGQLKKEYYTPELLGRVYRGERLPTVIGMDTVALPPVLSVVSDYNPATRKLQVQIKNDGGGVGKLMVKVNDRLLRTVEKPGSAAGGKSLTLPVELGEAPFIAGDNTIRITAYDAANRIESQPAVAHYVMSPAARGSSLVVDETGLSAGKFYAIIVGTSTFGGPDVPNLTFPAKDAERIATGIRLGADRLYGKDQVWMRVLTTEFNVGQPATGDGLPTKQNIRAAFDEVRTKARPEDTLLVYLSGHGAMSSTNRDLYYYLTVDARTFDIERNQALKDVSTVSSAELFQWLRQPLKTMPLKQVVILDTCAAGSASNDLMKLAERRDIPPDQRRAIELLKDATGTFILMGSAADSVSYEASRYGEGLLTYALLQGMRGESLDDGSRLGVNRWFEKASEDVPDLARSIGGIQKPVIAAPKGTGFPVALLTAEDRAQIPVATVKQQLLKVVCENEDQEDPLDLRTLVREQMRALNYNQAQGGGSAAAKALVMYLDATDDDLPGALAPKLRYVQTGDAVSVRIKLVSKERTTPEQTITGSAGDKQALANKLAETIVAMALAKP